MDLKELRKKIDETDEVLLKTFLDRMEISKQVAEYKKKTGGAILNKQREREILESVMMRSGELERYSHQLFSLILELSRSRQAEIISSDSKVSSAIGRALVRSQEVFPRNAKIACQGVEGANSQEACDKLFTRGNIEFFGTFEDVFEAVESGKCEFGVVPIENSTNGSVRPVYELMAKYNFSIVRSIRVHIKHELLVKPGKTLADIKEIHSHPQALGQCSKYLSELPEHIKVIPAANTAIAAQLVADTEDGSRAAISSHRCAELYGLESIDNAIQNSDNNYTRFICITKEPRIYEGANRISLTIAIGNRPGTLYDVLAKFAAMGVNMTKLESCAVAGRNFEFVFFIDIEASVKEKGIVEMLSELEHTTEELVFLGNYAEV